MFFFLSLSLSLFPLFSPNIKTPTASPFASLLSSLYRTPHPLRSPAQPHLPPVVVHLSSRCDSLGFSGILWDSLRFSEILWGSGWGFFGMLWDSLRLKRRFSSFLSLSPVNLHWMTVSHRRFHDRGRGSCWRWTQQKLIVVNQLFPQEREKEREREREEGEERGEGVAPEEMEGGGGGGRGLLSPRDAHICRERPEKFRFCGLACESFEWRGGGGGGGWRGRRERAGVVGVVVGVMCYYCLSHCVLSYDEMYEIVDWGNTCCNHCIQFDFIQFDWIAA